MADEAIRSGGTGVEQLHEQHRLFLEQLEELAITIPSAHDGERVRVLLAGLTTRAVNHFELEDNCLRVHGAEVTAVNRMDHRDLVARLGSIAAHFAAGGVTPAVVDAVGLLRARLVTHMRGCDEQLAGSAPSRQDDGAGHLA